MQNPFDTNSYVRTQAGKLLEWDEAAMDTQTDVEGFHDEQRQAPNLWWLRLLVVSCCIVLVGKLFLLQVNQGQVFGALA